jgi:hypothetical protein
MNRRVQDRRNYDLGTAVAEIRRGQYRVQWDDPTPHQDEAAVPIPSNDFMWVDASP